MKVRAKGRLPGDVGGARSRKYKGKMTEITYAPEGGLWDLERGFQSHKGLMPKPDRWGGDVENLPIVRGVTQGEAKGVGRGSKHFAAGGAGCRKIGGGNCRNEVKGIARLPGGKNGIVSPAPGPENWGEL